jgi:4-hydroxy-tetrahydrodipicolinate synthase
MFSGVYTALITPFKNGEVDYDSLARIIEMQVKGGVDGVVPMGTTGESPAVSHEEHIEVIRKTVEFVGKRIKVVAGAGSNSTREAVYITEAASRSGVDGILSVNPYYNKPTQKGLIAHFETVAKAAGVPVMLYNIPGRTGINFLPESVADLCNKAPNIRAMKEASGDIAQMMRLIEICGSRISVLSGDDNLFLPLLSVGGNGVVSVLSNILPAQMKDIYLHYKAGKTEEARVRFYKLLPLCRAMFAETNPIPVKWVMARSGYCGDEIRLPMTELAADKQDQVRAAFAAYGVAL